MKIKPIGLIITLFLVSIQVNAQSKVKAYVDDGIKHHDRGEYKKAIASYKKGLEIDPNSTLINYEIAFSYMQLEKYTEALKHADWVLQQNKGDMIGAYMLKASALDLLEKPKEAIQVFEEAIKNTKSHYLLYYNLAVTYHKINELDKAEENLFKALAINPNHASSHYSLAKIHDQKRNSVQAVLAAHYFLFIEPYSDRSIEIYQLLKDNFSGRVTKNQQKPNTTTMMLSTDTDSEFKTAELMISLLEASKSLEENKGKTETELFIENTESFFNTLGELQNEKHKSFWWTFYIPFFYDLAQAEHLETYCYYITSNSNENSQKWLDEHKDKASAFEIWFINY